MGKKTQHCLLLSLCLSWLVPCSATVVFWTAVVDISYVNSNNQTEDKYCECGVFGRSSPLERASGIVTLPKGDPRGCGPDPVYNRNASSPPWIALIKRGNCTFSEKINAAKRQGAAGVLVYNLDGSGNSTTHMAHSDAAGIVAVMVGNFQGTEIVKLVKNGTEVQMVIDVGSPHGPWMESYWLYFLSIAFFVVTAAAITYFVFISANRLYSLNRHRRSERKLKNEAKKAIGRLQVRTLKKDDEETKNDSHMCAVCIESYKAGEVVTVLTCDHIFHKGCIEPWLLERRTCPMCKCDILKALGVEEEAKDNMSVSSPPDVTVVTVTGGESLYEVPLNDPAGYDPDMHQHLYDNRAFEGDSEAARG
ncbi:E3 ubiquitin-protein ligase RNF128-like [Cheilinus undulatus]|uniref:E3 ubiquitin-protein ligase RNF128-like n=1 Tax=Cheilinus undulatus TaxID=241271 RepID=UPI001BD5514B|nr:E3 ubiquitin-protein ligase RNF128-like [Cheilinus undulatus]